MADAVLTSRVEGILVITLNRPEVRNAINSDLSLGVLDALAELDADDDLRVGVLTGSGTTFCAGLDLKAFAVDGVPKKIDDVFRYRCRKPLVAAIEGVALGGGLEMALVADLLVAARDARFGSPEVKFGLFPGGGALLRLPRHLPESIVTEMALTGEPISAELAFHHGLVARLCEPGDTVGGALELAAAIARNAPLGVSAAKQLLRMAPGSIRRGALDRAAQAGRLGLPFGRRPGGGALIRREAAASVDGALTRVTGACG